MVGSNTSGSFAGSRDGATGRADCRLARVRRGSSRSIDVATGALKWKHKAQPVREVDGQGRRHRSDDGRPMVVDGKVIIRVEDENSYALRALDPASGRVLWTTDALARRVMEKRGLLGARTLSSWIGAGPVVVGLVVNTEKTELMGWRTSDGRLLWVREVPSVTSLTASAGGVFYTALDRPERKEISPSDELVIEGFEAATGTKLWSTGISSHNRPFEGEWSITQISYGAPGGPGWRIGPDGAIYDRELPVAADRDVPQDEAHQRTRYRGRRRRQA